MRLFCPSALALLAFAAFHEDAQAQRSSWTVTLNGTHASVGTGCSFRLNVCPGTYRVSYRTGGIQYRQAPWQPWFPPVHGFRVGPDGWWCGGPCEGGRYTAVVRSAQNYLLLGLRGNGNCTAAANSVANNTIRGFMVLDVERINPASVRYERFGSPSGCSPTILGIGNSSEGGNPCTAQDRIEVYNAVPDSMVVVAYRAGPWNRAVLGVDPCDLNVYVHDGLLLGGVADRDGVYEFPMSFPTSVPGAYHFQAFNMLQNKEVNASYGLQLLIQL